MFHQPHNFYNADGSTKICTPGNESLRVTNNTYCIVERLDYLIQLQVQTNEMLYQLLNKKE